MNPKRFLATLVMLLAAHLLRAQGTAITYQGRLSDNGAPANGLYDLTFTLYDNSSGGSGVGPALTDPAVAVDGGTFTVTLDFGGGVFTGPARWLEIGVRTNGGGAFTVLTPRQWLTPQPYAIYAENAGLASSASAVMNGSVSAPQFNTPAAPASGQVLAFNGANLVWTNPGPAAAAWGLTGNAGTSAGANFLGTTDNQPLELHAYGDRALQLAFASKSIGGPTSFFGNDSTINLVGGFWGNGVSNAAIGATIAGGGYSFFSFLFGESDYPNTVTNDFGAIGGGANNTVGGYFATVPGGSYNRAFGDYSFVAGRRAVSQAAGAFVFADAQNADFVSTLTNEVALRADNGLYLASQRGIRMNAQDRPIITRAWDAFDVSAPNGKAFCGRWGLFMEPGSLTLGFPDVDVGYRRMEVARYRTDGTRDTLLTVGNDGVTTVKVLTITGGADLAEPFEMAGDAIPKGAVVVIDEEHPGQLKISTRPYDRRVAGIVSGANGIRPGLALHQDGVNGAGQNVALTGRVFARAAASNGAIHPGDLLTTSARPGHAMKVTDHARAQGAVLGKAMSSLETGDGMVLVLVTLQ